MSKSKKNPEIVAIMRKHFDKSQEGIQASRREKFEVFQADPVFKEFYELAEELYEAGANSASNNTKIGNIAITGCICGAPSGRELDLEGNRICTKCGGQYPAPNNIQKSKQ